MPERTLQADGDRGHTLHLESDDTGYITLRDPDGNEVDRFEVHMYLWLASDALEGMMKLLAGPKPVGKGKGE